MMLTTLTMNPCIDRSVFVQEFREGEANRVISAREDPSGKGVNVSVAYRALGGSTCCVAPRFEQKGELLQQKLESCGISFRLIKTAGLMRTNIKILDLDSGVYTELNEKGEALQQQVLDKIGTAVEEMAVQSSGVALCGSLPQGVPPDFYRALIERLSGVPVILDASGEALRLGVKAQPYVIKPNLAEFSALTGKKYRTKEEILSDARLFLEKGVGVVCVSLGEEGALLTAGTEAWFAPPIPLRVLGVQGAGDSMVAGLYLAMAQGGDAQTMLRYGVAAASASLEREGTQLCEREDFNRMLDRVVCQRL